MEVKAPSNTEIRTDDLCFFIIFETHQLLSLS